jgi:hypothetical protein
VPGAACVADDGAGAAGAAGVWAGTGAGVEGVALLDEAAVVFGYIFVSEQMVSCEG